ncbi:MAG: rhodanese-like domain-containing protein [Planctomycetota bacterium]
MRTIALTLLQAVVLLGLGVVVGLGGNAARSRDRIDLTRNYAPVIPRPVPPDQDTPNPAEVSEPYGTVTLDEVARIVADTSRVGLDVILDARNQKAFERGHLPGAIRCDPYNLERDFDYAVSMALGAERVVIYCHGGKCEDSYLLAQELLNHGLLTERIYIFKGGWEAWEAHTAGTKAPVPENPAPAGSPPAMNPESPVAPPATESPPPAPTPAEPSLSPPDKVAEPRFQEVSLSEAIALFEDQKTTHGSYVFVDARVDESYEAGHIPGAVQCDFYRIDYYFPDLLRRAAHAEKIIVYCGNADCEDSLYVCGELLKSDAHRAHILLFKGGWKEWNEAGLPLATGREQ